MNSPSRARIILPWPLKGLSPNDRVHWRVKAKATKAYRFTAATLAREAGWHMREAMPEKIAIEFCPPSGWRTGDMDNLIARFKAGQDGLADALRVNDAKLNMTHAMGDRCKDGAVIVTIGK